MAEKTWLGSIFIKNEGGFEIIMRALNHYNRRLHRISDSPEIADTGAMFGSILQSEATKNTPKLKPIANRLRTSLTDTSTLSELEKDTEIIEKAMICYKADIIKAVDDADVYYTRLLEGNSDFKSDLPKIDDSIKRLKQYC